MNGDSLSGSAGSVFTSGGTPVAWSATNDNLYRLRGGWLGAGVVVLEILSPDGAWVPMHTYHFPNTLSNSYTYTTTWNYQAEVFNTTNATSITMYMGGAAFGSTDPTYRMTDVMNGTTNAIQTKSALFGQYLSSPPSLSTSGNYNALQITSAANLKTDNTSWGGTVLGTPTNFGTSPGAVIASSTNASIFVGTTAATAATFGTTASGTGVLANASLFMGTTAARSNQTTTAAGVQDVNIVGSLGVTNSATNGTFVRITDNTTALTAAVSALGTAPTGTSVLAVNNVALPSAAAGAACSLYSNATLTTAVAVKASAGNLYGVIVSGTAGNFVQFLNIASAPTLGTGALFSIPIPSGGVLVVMPGSIGIANFTTGISVGISTTYNGASAGSSASVAMFYK